MAEIKLQMVRLRDEETVVIQSSILVIDTSVECYTWEQTENECKMSVKSMSLKVNVMLPCNVEYNIMSTRTSAVSVVTGATMRRQI